MVDGGYLDNSAADNLLSLVDLIDQRREQAAKCYAQRYLGCSNDPDEQKVMNVERRIQIIVIAIRNDPLDPGTSVFDIPALKPLDRDSIPFASRYSASLSNEFLSTHLPSALQSEELMGPLDALVATREARGVVTREILQSALKINARPFYQMCRDRLEKAASNRRGISRSDLLEIGLSEKTADRVLD